jgi:CheY-like chemotaxis protein
MDRATQEVSIATSGQHAAGLRILVVEDDPDSALSAATLLRLYGHQVQVARCGTEALDLARKGETDVVLLDIAMPGMSGYDLARQLRRNNGHVPLLVAVTGCGQAEDRQRSQEAGIDLHLLKPVEPDELEAILRKFQKSILGGGRRRNFP